MTENAENTAHLVSVAARVEPQLAQAVRRLAEAGDRPLSREIRRALLEHVATCAPGSYREEAKT